MARGMWVRSCGSGSTPNMGGPSGAESKGAGHHGDLMTAVALAVWWQGLTLVRPG